MIAVSYALDIGVYNLGGRGQVLASTTTAWARVHEGLNVFDDLGYAGSCDAGAFSRAAGSVCACGRSIEALADAIADDLRAGNAIALGFEAPMWFPSERSHRPNLQMFSPRFGAERGTEWYLQSGAAATLKAIGLGMLLFTLLLERQPKLNLTTDPKSAGRNLLVVYEAFVVGSFKIPLPVKAGRAANEWDAFTAGLAWGALNCGFLVPRLVGAQELHVPGSFRGDAVSVWQMIAASVPTKPEISGPADCQVVGLAEVAAAG